MSLSRPSSSLQRKVGPANWQWSNQRDATQSHMELVRKEGKKRKEKRGVDTCVHIYTFRFTIEKGMQAPTFIWGDEGRRQGAQWFSVAVVGFQRPCNFKMTLLIAKRSL